MSKTILEMLEEVVAIQEAAPKGDDDLGADADLDTKGGGDLGDEGDEEDNEPSDKDLPDGKGHYTADDLREIIDYVRDLLKDELDGADEDDDDMGGGKDKGGEPDDIGEIGLDLIYEYADLLPETVINQMVDDLKDMFEIEDTMLEQIVSEGSAFFNKAKKSPAAIAAKKKMREFYVKNKKRIMARNQKWRNTDIGKKIAKLHKSIFKGIGKVKGKRVVHQL